MGCGASADSVPASSTRTEALVAMRERGHSTDTSGSADSGEAERERVAAKREWARAVIARQKNARHTPRSDEAVRRRDLDAWQMPASSVDVRDDCGGFDGLWSVEFPAAPAQP
eukprot:CAMPEP_0174831566 /NCGR_PEP_ID=MMETSP1114-20130205/3168_1 /TAXON_ID=312471 /ORGANISM="Neobodo designis, Strain CCAP 1951/1" /LENGTH=112 /DNA_ID=CAMNT_0016065393 /DNA_START=41 /DNA_END=379 /DNA_ORIENTATION=-